MYREHEAISGTGGPQGPVHGEGREGQMAQPFGPVTVSRLKKEAPAVFAALDAGRQVLVSRHGTVVAQIDPPDPITDMEALVGFAVTGEIEGLNELTATTIGQGSPSRMVRSAEAGTPAYVTREGRLVGFLRTRVVEPFTLGATWVEQQLSTYERDHPHATAEELDEVMDDLQERASNPAAAVGLHLADLAHAAPGRARTRVAALEIEVEDLVRSGRLSDAERAYRELFSTVGSVVDPTLTITVVRAIDTMGKAYAAHGDDEKTLTATAKALEFLSPPAPRSAETDS